MEKDYSLKESFEKIGALPIPILVDQKGKVIDGFHRSKEGLRGKVPEVVIKVKSPLEEHLLRLALNQCRRQMSVEEKRAILVSIAELTGWKPKEMAKHLPVSYTWIMTYLPDKYKEKAWTQKERASPITRRVIEKPLKMESEEEFAERFTGLLKNHVSRVMKEDLGTLINHMNPEQNCAECKMDNACSFLLDLLKVSGQLPRCMQRKATKQACLDGLDSEPSA
jgi:hypothetical protein